MVSHNPCEPDCLQVEKCYDKKRKKKKGKYINGGLQYSSETEEPIFITLPLNPLSPAPRILDFCYWHFIAIFAMLPDPSTKPFLIVIRGRSASPSFRGCDIYYSGFHLLKKGPLMVTASSWFSVQGTLEALSEKTQGRLIDRDFWLHTLREKTMLLRDSTH